MARKLLILASREPIPDRLLGRPVIWTCREDDMERLHFDIRQYNTIDWKTPEDLAARLQHRIEAAVGKGPEAVLNS